MVQGYYALTDKEKQTLRLLLDGHDAKSMARHIGLSVHTVNERLRDARRKLSVSSSKEAARLLRQVESADPEILGDRPFGDAAMVPEAPSIEQPKAEPLPTPRAAWAVGGFIMIAILIATLALSASAERSRPDDQPVASASAQSAIPETAIAKAARDWLELVDNGKWAESWAATGQSFQSLNTVETWQSVSEKVRLPLGRVLSRTFVAEQDVPAPPHGYRMVRFHTDFANRKGATETLSLDQEGDSWKVVGVYIE